MALLTTPDHELFNPSNLDELEHHVAKQVRSISGSPSRRMPVHIVTVLVKFPHR
jgi:hypothetical protein